MTKKSIYLKYRQERDYAKHLKELKKNTWQINKVARVRLERVDLNALMKKKPSIPVSLPIKHFNNMHSTVANNDGQEELQTPKDKNAQIVRQDVPTIAIAPTSNLRMMRHKVVAAKRDTTAATTIINSRPINPNLLPVNLTLPATRDAEKKSKKVETYTPSSEIITAATAKMPFQSNDQISMKCKPTKENYGILHRPEGLSNSKEVGANNLTKIIDKGAKANVTPFQGKDHINIKYPYYPQKKVTAEKACLTSFPYGIASRKINFTNSNEVGTNTSTDIIDTGGISNHFPSIKHKLPVPEVPTKKKNEIEHRDVNPKYIETSTPTNIINTATRAHEISSAHEVKRCLKALVITSTQTDTIHIVNENESQILSIVTKSGVTNDELVDALESFKKVKELGKYNVTEVIDLDGSNEENCGKILELAKFHSEKNKKAIYENCVRASNSTSTKSAPTPIDHDQQKKIWEMRYKLVNSMTYEQLKNVFDSQNKTNNKENSNKKRKSTESGDNYDEANMEMEVDVPETRTIVNQPDTETPLPKRSLQKSTPPQPQMQPINAQNHMLQLQQIIRQDAHLESLQHHKMQQQQYLQELKQNNMREKPKQPQQPQPQPQNPHTQQPYLKSPQFLHPNSNCPQFQQPHLKSPQIQHPHSKSPQFFEPYARSPQTQQPQSISTHNQLPQSPPTGLQGLLQHPLDQRIRIRDQQRAAFPQQHYQYESARNGYQNPETINSTQQPQFGVYPGDPRLLRFQSQMPQVMPATTPLMSTYQANLRTSKPSYPYQKNHYNNHHYW